MASQIEVRLVATVWPLHCAHLGAIPSAPITGVDPVRLDATFPFFAGTVLRASRRLSLHCLVCTSPCVSAASALWLAIMKGYGVSSLLVGLLRLFAAGRVMIGFSALRLTSLQLLAFMAG